MTRSSPTASTITVRAARRSDAQEIARIYNQGIEDRTATFETSLRDEADVLARLETAERFPVLVAEDALGRIAGWAGIGAYRPRACYAGIGEFSIYLDRRLRGRGIGRQLLTGLIDAARDLGYWKLISRVFPTNAASRALCRACGFREVGTYEKHGRLDGAWRDVVIVERLIPENLEPGE
jgi:phosphinothricin acetyltransferase